MKKGGVHWATKVGPTDSQQRVHSESPAGHGRTAVKGASRSTKRCERSQWRRPSAGGADATGWGRRLQQHIVQAAFDNVGRFDVALGQVGRRVHLPSYPGCNSNGWQAGE